MPDPTDRRSHTIRSLKVTGGGFLDGFEVEFSPGLNCIIGGRGTGKTTVLEFLRFALGAMPDARRGAEKRADGILKLVKANLKRAGRIHVQVETREGTTYHVRSTLDDPPLVLDQEGNSTPLKLGPGSVFDVDVYSHNEIEEIATSRPAQLELIDRLAGPELLEVKQRLRAVRRELETNAGAIKRVASEAADLSEGLSELQGIEDRLQAFERAAEEGPELELEREIALKGLRDAEARALRAAAAELSTQGTSVRELRERLARRFEVLVPQTAREGPNGAALERVHGALLRCAETVATQLAAALAAIEDCAGEVEAEQSDLAQAHATQEQRYRDLLERHTDEQERAEERIRLQRRRNELLERQREREGRDRSQQELAGRRGVLLRELSALQDRRAALRRGVVERLRSQLPREIRVEIAFRGGTDEYRQVLTEALKGRGRQYTDLVQAVVSALLPPGELARLVRAEDAGALAEQLGLETQRAQRLVEALKESEALLALETIELGDVPSIALWNGEDYKDSSALSTGQKCTTVLPILLLESEKPLLIDQPEDNLDNEFIYTAVVTQIQRVQPQRQLIFATHNPNIPVLGEAGQVIVMRPGARRASLEASGTVDQVKGHIETILEGGPAAFQERKRRYGY
ncbi:MAG: AAA family ATPase [Vicinamibacteria bacterium]